MGARGKLQMMDYSPWRACSWEINVCPMRNPFSPNPWGAHAALTRRLSHERPIPLANAWYCVSAHGVRSTARRLHSVPLLIEPASPRERPGRSSLGRSRAQRQLATRMTEETLASVVIK